MSFQLPTERRSTGARPRWAGAAFLVEAMLLLVFLTASLAVFTQLFAAATERAGQSRALSEAVVAGTTVAERFAADPASVQRETYLDGMVVVCDRSVEGHAAGSLTRARVSVYAAGDGTTAATQGDALFTIETAHYDREVI